MILKRFITQDDKKRINRVLFETEKFKNQEKYALIVGIKLSTPNNTKFTQKKQRILVKLLETCLILSTILVNYTTLQMK